MYDYPRRSLSEKSGFSLIELVIVIFIAGFLTRITSPYAIQWLRRQQTISYLNEMKEFIRLVRGEARRWSASCEILLSEKTNDSFGNTLIGTIGSPETLSTLLMSAPNVLTNPVKVISPSWGSSRTLTGETET